MPKTKVDTKTVMQCTRITPRIKEIIDLTSAQEGITPSEWLRNLILKELRSKNALPTVFRVPTIEEEN